MRFNSSLSFSSRKVLGPPSLASRKLHEARSAVQRGKETTLESYDKIFATRPYHMLGDHKDWRDSYCKRKNLKEENNEPFMKAFDVWVLLDANVYTIKRI